jgi:tetratricopeptide (TPR) repeat protein
MIDSKPDLKEGEPPGDKARWKQRGMLAAVCALVIGIYAYTAHGGAYTQPTFDAADNYYNLLVQGFRAGQLDLKEEAPPVLARLADPYAYSPVHPGNVLDLSYYKGKLYLYFGVTPAVILFWPYVVLTGQYLFFKEAVVLFCVVGYLASVGLLCAIWRRYFAEVSIGVVAAGALALGVVTWIPPLLARCDIYEVAVSCGYALTMLALAAIWKSLHESRTRWGWLAVASIAYGLAVGARPNLLFGAVILLVPVIQAWRERRPVLAALLAATGPIALIGLGLTIYNFLRFDNPFEFGLRYQLRGDRQLTRQFFALRYMWFNFQVYFLEPARWRARFPFVDDIRTLTAPAGHGNVDEAFGVLTNIPLVWLALCAPLAWRSRSAEARSVLGWFLAAVALLFGIGALTLGVFVFADGRYEVDFLTALVLLAVVGILGLERTLAPTSESGQADRPVPRRAARWCWGLLLGFSVAFNLLSSVKRYAEADFELGNWLLGQGQVQKAVEQWEQALRLKPDYADAHYNLGNALLQAGKMQEAIGHYEQTVRLKPDFAEGHFNLGLALERAGRVQEAIQHYEQAARLKPGDAKVHNTLGVALKKLGRLREAISQYEQAVQIRPDYAEAHYNLGNVLLQMDKAPEAISHYEQALRVNPDYAVAHYNLGVALEKLGRTQEAIQHYEEALRLKPDFVQAQSSLTRARAAP